MSDLAPAGIERWSLRFRIFLFFALVALAGSAAVAAGLFFGWSRLDDAARDAAAPALIIGGIVGAAGLAAVTLWVWMRFDDNVARPIERLAQDLSARARIDAGPRIETTPGRWLGALAPAAADAAAALHDARGALGSAVAQETTALSARRDQLESVINALPDGLVICTGDHRVLLFNARAAAMLTEAAPDAPAPGLDRPLRRWLRTEPLDHAGARIAEGGDVAGGVAELLCAAADGGRMFAGRMAPLPFAPGGYALSFRDATGEMEGHAVRDQLLEDVLEAVRRASANIGALLTARRAAGAGPALDDALDGESAALRDRLRDLARRQDAAIAAHWPMSATAPIEIAGALKARLAGMGRVLHLGAGLAEGDAPPLLRCDMLSILAVLELAADTAMEQTEDGVLTLSIFSAGADGPARREAALELGWTGAPLPSGVVEDVLSRPLGIGLRGLTGREALAHHRTGLWPARSGARARLILPLPLADAPASRRAIPGAARPEFYDFDLMRQPGGSFDDTRLLRDLSFVVFDTETTGLSPSGGDEIVQIAAARVLGGRVLQGETFDALVNPGRTIPPASTVFHGLTDAHVADAPGIAQVGRAFHAFAEGSVLVAHNAPFDMAFLRRKEKTIGLRFDNPVADTVAVSARLDPSTAKHTLDALCERYGVTIPEEVRHTALGDALATAEVFARLIPLLEAEGVRTLGDLLSVGQRIHAIRREQSQY